MPESVQTLEMDTQDTQAPRAEGAILSPFVITEMIPNTANVGGSDGYEYFELANLTDKELDFSDYDLVYDNGSKTIVWTPDVQTIPAGGSLLVWVKNEDNIAAGTTVEEFRQKYGLGEDMPVAQVNCDGMSNSGSRSMSVVTKTGRTLFTVEYAAEGSSNGKLDENEAISYVYSGDQITVQYDRKPTPGTWEGQVTGAYTAPAAVENPSVTVSAEGAMEVGQDLAVSVSDTNLAQIIRAQIAVEGGSTYEMTYNDEGLLTGAVPYGMWRSSPRLRTPSQLLTGPTGRLRLLSP